MIVKMVRLVEMLEQNVTVGTESQSQKQIGFSYIRQLCTDITGSVTSSVPLTASFQDHNNETTIPWGLELASELPKEVRSGFET